MVYFRALTQPREWVRFLHDGLAGRGHRALPISMLPLCGGPVPFAFLLRNGTKLGEVWSEPLTLTGCGGAILTASTANVPEPGSAALTGIGLVGLLALAWRLPKTRKGVAREG